jgi:hypothetical protein
MLQVNESLTRVKLSAAKVNDKDVSALQTAMRKHERRRLEVFDWLEEFCERRAAAESNGLPLSSSASSASSSSTKFSSTAKTASSSSTLSASDSPFVGAEEQPPLKMHPPPFDYESHTRGLLDLCMGLAVNTTLEVYEGPGELPLLRRRTEARQEFVVSGMGVNGLA